MGVSAGCYDLQVCWPVLVTGLLHTFMGIPAILAGILTQLGLYSVNLKIMGKANQAINVDKYRSSGFSALYQKCMPFYKNTIFMVAVIMCRSDRIFCTGSLEQSLDAPFVQPDVMPEYVPRTGYQYRL